MRGSAGRRLSLVPFIAPPAKRPIMIGLISASRGLATTFGPLIGGALTERVSWRWNFYINLPLGVAIQVAFFAFVRPPKRESEAFTSWTDLVQNLDLFGLISLLPSVVCLLLALQWGGIKYPWSDPRVIVLLVLCGGLAIAFTLTEMWQGPKALLPPRVFTQRTVSAASFYGFCTTGAIFVLTYYLPMYVISVVLLSILYYHVGANHALIDGSKEFGVPVQSNPGCTHFPGLSLVPSCRSQWESSLPKWVMLMHLWSLQRFSVQLGQASLPHLLSKRVTGNGSAIRLSSRYCRVSLVLPR
jgi:Arabinose efflux permease